MKITLPLPPNLANSRFHWRVKQNKKKAYFEACDISYWIVHKTLPALPFERSKIGATIYCGGKMDVDNIFARLKFPVDWMVRMKLLAGDSPKHLVWEMPEQVVKRKQQYRVEFEITED